MINFTVASFVDEFSDGFSAGITKLNEKLPESDVRLNFS